MRNVKILIVNKSLIKQTKAIMMTKDFAGLVQKLNQIWLKNLQIKMVNEFNLKKEILSIINDWGFYNCTESAKKDLIQRIDQVFELMKMEIKK